MKRMKPSQRNPAFRWILALAVVVGLVLTVKYTRWQVLPKRFRVVEAGRLYRGGYPEPWPYARLIKKHGIRTIVSLYCLGPEDPRYQKEQAIVKEFGLEFHCFPMPGDGRGDYDKLEAAADLLADPANQPVFFHCAAGVNRTNATLAAYRMRHEGWSFERAAAECVRYGLCDNDMTAWREHMHGFYEQRVLPYRAGGAGGASRQPPARTNGRGIRQGVDYPRMNANGRE